MRITTQNSYGYNKNYLSFNSWCRDVYKKSAYGNYDVLAYRNDTKFFRNSEFWAQLTHFLVNKFKDLSKVNVYSYGCSDGSEPFTFVMRMLSMYNAQDYEKFFPVIAKDCDKEAINKTQEGEYYFIEASEKADINYYTKGAYKRFITDISKVDNVCKSKLSSELYRRVKFSVGDISKDYKNIKPDNSVVFLRNFWPYIEYPSDRQKLLNKIGNKLGQNSYIIIGEFDERGTEQTIDIQLQKAGFKKTPINYVYEKSSVPQKEKGVFNLLHRFF